MTNSIDILNKFKLGVVGQRVTDFLAISRLAPIKIFITCEGGEDAVALASNSRLLSPELEDNHRKAWTNRSLGDLASFASETVRELSQDPSSPLFLLAYSSTDQWERFSAESGVYLNVIAPPAGVKNKLDDKIFVRNCLSQLGLPVPKSVALDDSQLDYDSLIGYLGNPFIVQKAVGSSGIGTYKVTKESELRQVRNESYIGKWLASSYGGSCTLNIHGLAINKNDIRVSMPSIQLTGVKGLSNTWGSYCGNDFGAAKSLPSLIIEKSQQLTERVGKWLVTEDYFGIFGVDIIIQNNSGQILEVNPRLQGSTWLLSELEIEGGKVPLAIEHFLCLLGNMPGREETSQFIGGAVYAILHSHERNPRWITHRLRPGAFVLSAQGKLIWLRKAVGLLEIEGEEILLFGMPPRPTSLVEPGAVLVRMATRAQIVSPDGRDLTLFGSQLVEAVSHEFVNIQCS